MASTLLSPSEALGLPMGLLSSKSSTSSRGSFQGSAGELLFNALEKLSEMDFKRFRDVLAHGDLQGQRCIPWGRLQKADWTDTKNLMLRFYGGDAALNVAEAVLEQIHLRDTAAWLLEEREKGGKAEVGTVGAGGRGAGATGIGSPGVLRLGGNRHQTGSAGPSPEHRPEEVVVSPPE
nr:PREDICTED: NACHT, LRR and PYD domains-containing protein 6 [Struthio camelus australis]